MSQQIGFNQTFTGVVKGVIQEMAGPPDKQWEETILVCEGEKFEVYKFKLRKDDVQKNIKPQLEKYAGQMVTFKCGSSHRAWRDRVFTDHYYQGELKKEQS